MASKIAIRLKYFDWFKFKMFIELCNYVIDFNYLI